MHGKLENTQNHINQINSMKHPEPIEELPEEEEQASVHETISDNVSVQSRKSVKKEPSSQKLKKMSSKVNHKSKLNIDIENLEEPLNQKDEEFLIEEHNMKSPNLSSRTASQFTNRIL
jgi:hypothetical protein